MEPLTGAGPLPTHPPRRRGLQHPYLVLPTPGTIHRRVQLGVTGGPHRAPQSVAHILQGGQHRPYSHPCLGPLGVARGWGCRWDSQWAPPIFPQPCGAGVPSPGVCSPEHLQPRPLIPAPPLHLPAPPTYNNSTHSPSSPAHSQLTPPTHPRTSPPSPAHSHQLHPCLSRPRPLKTSPTHSCQLHPHLFPPRPLARKTPPNKPGYSFTG